MVYYSVQVVCCLKLKLLFHKGSVRGELSYVKIADGEVDQVLQLTPLLAI